MKKIDLKPSLTDDINEPLGYLVEHRLPWLTFGLIGGIITSVIVSNFKDILAADVRLAFFIPFIVYMSSAVGMQTETIYVRHLRRAGTSLGKYLPKEIGLGLCLGIIFGLVSGLFAWYWLKSLEIGLTVGISMLINVALAPALATFIPALLYREHTDPALGAGPLATILQDLISLLIYLLVAWLIIF